MRFKSDKQRKAAFASMNANKGVKKSSMHPKVIVKNKPDPNLVRLIKSEVAMQDKQLGKHLKTVYVEHSDHPVRGALGIYNTGKGAITIYDENGLSMPQQQANYQHEYDHAQYHQLLETHPNRIHWYEDEVKKLNPPTANAENYKNNLDRFKDFAVDYKFLVDENHYQKTLDEIIDFLQNEYCEEVHSETGEYLKYNELGLDADWVTDQNAMNQAIKLYNKLHNF